MNKNQVANVPNLLSALRLLLMFYVVDAATSGWMRLAFVFFVIASVTDFLDGWIARRWNLRTELGAWLDPVADKFLMAGTFIALGLVGIVPWWLVVIVVGRDVYLLLAASACMLFTSLHEFPPSKFGKWSTTFQMMFVIVVMVQSIVHIPASLNGLDMIVVCLRALVVLFAFVTAIEYTLRGFVTLRRIASVR